MVIVLIFCDNNRWAVIVCASFVVYTTVVCMKYQFMQTKRIWRTSGIFHRFEFINIGIRLHLGVVWSHQSVVRQSHRSSLVRCTHLPRVN